MDLSIKPLFKVSNKSWAFLPLSRAAWTSLPLSRAKNGPRCLYHGPCNHHHHHTHRCHNRFTHRMGLFAFITGRKNVFYIYHGLQMPFYVYHGLKMDLIAFITGREGPRLIRKIVVQPPPSSTCVIRAFLLSEWAFLPLSRAVNIDFTIITGRMDLNAFITG